MSERFKRTELLIGNKALKQLEKSHIAVFGIGGVGGYAVEALARGGVGHIDLIDNDVVSESNINRQIIASYKTIGRYKTEIMKERIAEINPDLEVNAYNLFYLPDSPCELDFCKYDYIVDAIDTVSAKIGLAMLAEKLGIPLISCMGTGNKLDPTALKVSDIYKTSICPLARVMRHELKKRGIKKLKVVYSQETPIKVQSTDEGQVPGSTSFVPPVAGMIIASEVIKDIISGKEDN